MQYLIIFEDGEAIQTDVITPDLVKAHGDLYIDVFRFIDGRLERAVRLGESEEWNEVCKVREL